jgi:indolepyruvate ferredoxin oxidoreductase
MERQLVIDYRNTIDELLTGLSLGNHALAVEIARLPEQIRGYGHVKEGNVAKVRAKWSELMAHWRDSAAEREAA